MSVTLTDVMEDRGTVKTIEIITEKEITAMSRITPDGISWVMEKQKFPCRLTVEKRCI
jgi:hypothetical protein